MVEWQLQWGQNEEFLFELAEDGRDVAALEIKPRLTVLQAIAYDGFWLLSPGRVLGMGVGGITTVDILTYANAMGLDPEWFLRLVRVMDRVYTDHLNKEKPKTPTRAATKKPRKGR